MNNYSLTANVNPCGNTSFAFANSFGTLTNAQWIYGNGAVSSIMSTPGGTTYTYPNAGVYTAYLTGAGIAPCLVSTQVTVQALGEDFTFSQNDPCDPAQGVALSITNYSGSPISYQWNVNASATNTTATSQSATYFGFAPGINTVTLKVGNGTCVGNITKTLNIGAPGGFYVYANPISCNLFNLSYTGNGTSTLSNVQWAFGDGNNSPVMPTGSTSVNHAYPGPGNYVVTLSGTGLSPCVLQTTLNVGSFTIADFNYTVNNLCSPAAGVILSINNYNSSNTYQWTINNLVLPATGASGTYYTNLVNGINTIKLSITGSGGCNTSSTKMVTIGAPAAAFSTYTNVVCLGDPLSVYGVTPGGTNYSWNVTDGSNTNVQTGMTPIYNFTATGTYTVKLTVSSVVSNNGVSTTCTNTFAATVSVSSIPSASFTTSPVSCNKSVTLSLSSPGSFGNYSIDYGDGTVLTGGSSIPSADLTHTYVTSLTFTTYPVSITLSNGACVSTYTQNVLISGGSSLAMLAPEPFICMGGSAAISAQVNVNGPSPGALSYNWSGPGGFTSTQAAVSVTAGGMYSLTVSSTGSCAISLSGTKSVTALADPTGTVSAVANLNCTVTSGGATLAINPSLLAQGYLINGTAAGGSPANYILSGLGQGVNNVVIANALHPSCSAVLPVSITRQEPAVSFSVTQALNCSPGYGSAAISVSPANGTGYWFSTAGYPGTVLSSGMSSGNLSPGSYIGVYVDNTCTITSNFNLVLPVINVSKTGPVATCSNGTAPTTLTSQFSVPGGGGAIISHTVVSVSGVVSGSGSSYSLAPGAYTAIASINGCTASTTFSIGTTAPLSLTLAGNDPSCKNPGDVTALPSGGDGNYTFKWYQNGTLNSNTLSTLGLGGITGATTVSVTVKDGSGCSTAGLSSSVVVTPPTAISLQPCGGVSTYSATHISGCGISTCLQGGQAPYTYEWYSVGTTSPQVTWAFAYSGSNFVATNGTQTVTLSAPSSSSALNLGNNSDFDNTTVSYPFWDFSNSPATPQMNPVGTGTAGSASSSTVDYYTVLETVTLTSGGQLVSAYSGGSGATGSTENFVSGDYQLTVTDALGCSSTFTISSLTFTAPTTFSIAFDFVFGMNRTEQVPDTEDPALHDNMVEAANELLDQANRCAEQKSRQLKSYLDGMCTDVKNVKDALTVGYTIADHHHTLYYYDRAGRLTKTVPPQGVEYTSAANVAALKSIRSTTTQPGSWPTLTPHRMATTYEYNSFGQLLSQNTPDGGGTRFIYDSKNRLRFSQNDKQRNGGKDYFSYTKYDSLGRIIEVGESTMGSLDFANLTATVNLALADQMSYPPMVSGGTVLRQVTRTVYSAVAPVTYYGKAQRYTQNRVSYTYYDEDPTAANDEQYTYYSYDSHGNVEWLAQDQPGGLGLNYLAYEYDLVSGKVLKVSYNEKRADRFYHRYTYDAENRLVKAETSRNGELWDADAAYSYYPHGPLKRTVLGEDHVQGLDYIYTIHGWIKGINSPKLNTAADPGADNDPFASLPVVPQQRVAADRFGMVLNYYAGDYLSNTTNYLMSTGQYSLGAYSATNGAAPGLYNGNISGWIQSQLDATASTTIAARADLFQYDLLNRIKQSTAVKEDAANSSWTDLTTSNSNTYKTTYTYDANGNILNLKRYDNTATLMDDLNYDYGSGGGNAAQNKNMLTAVSDAVMATVSGRQDLQDTHNYTYDAIGNLIKETGKELLAVGNGVGSNSVALRQFTTEIDWNVYGKIKEIRKQVQGGQVYKERIGFKYDAAGNRVEKQYWKDGGTTPDGSEQPDELTTTWYVRDAQGNTMATYQRYYDSGSGLYKIDLTEQPIYGSDRIGENIAKVTLASGANYNTLAMPTNGMASSSEYQNWITTTSKTALLPDGETTDNLCQCKVLLLKNSNSNANYNSVTTAIEMLGIANNGVAVAEDLNKQLQFYVVLSKKYLGGQDACLVFDQNGN